MQAIFQEFPGFKWEKKTRKDARKKERGKKQLTNELESEHFWASFKFFLRQNDHNFFLMQHCDTNSDSIRKVYLCTHMCKDLLLTS